jgi:hypothetical protein
MPFLKNLTTIMLISATCLSFFSQALLATTSVRRVSQAQATGDSGKIPTIEVWIGSGINLNFLLTGETIERVWLDDPSRLVVDFDDVNCVAGNTCRATVLHLRRINPLNFPELPQSSTTLLSVITSSPSGRKLYQFRIAYGSGSPQYYTVTLVPEKPPLPGIKPEPSIELIAGGRASLVDVQRGLNVAKAQGMISELNGNVQLEYQVLDFIALVRNGTSPTEASARAGVTMAAIEKLAQIGKSTLFDKLHELESVDVLPTD